MSTTPFTLDDIRAAAEAKYGDFTIDIGAQSVRLLNPLRLSKAARATLTKGQEALDGEEVDEQQKLEELIINVAETPAKGKALVKALGGDLTQLATVFEKYGEKVQAGEASASQA